MVKAFQMKILNMIEHSPLIPVIDIIQLMTFNEVDLLTQEYYIYRGRIYYSWVNKSWYPSN